MKRIIRRYELTDAEWERLKPYFPERQLGDKGRPRREPREILNGIFWIARSGAAWRDLPERYGPYSTVYKRFREWSESGLIEKIFHELGEDADLQDISIDSSYIKAHKASAGAERGGSQNPQKRFSRGGRSTKIHAAVDALGNPIAIMLTTGNTADITVAQKLISQIDFKGSTILADRAYTKCEFREFITNHGADYCIPPTSNISDPWPVDWWLYKERHLVETFFLKLKEFRRVAMRFDKLASRFLSFVHLACIRILLA